MTSAEFDLRALVRTVLRESDASEPGVIADLVFAAIGESQRDDALRQALRPLVREVISQHRMQNALPLGVPAAPSKTPGSWKVKAIRDAHQSALRNRIHVGGDAGWKLLADCTRDDLLFAADERRVAAERSAATARVYAALADLLAEHGVLTVSGLPLEVLVRSLGSAAA